MNDAARDPPRVDGIGRRHHLTVLFTDLSDSTSLGDQLEAEHYAQMLAALRALCREIVPRHGGRIARLQGDGMLAIFGYPEPQEDDGRRAIEAALDLHQAIGQVAVAGSIVGPGTLSLHSGVHAGLTFVSDGDLERGRFELLGSVPNTASRLSDMARRGEIVVSEETLGPQAHFFTIGEREWTTPRGRDVALPVCRVHGRAAARRRYEASVQRGPARFVGREGPMRQLDDALRAAATAPGCLAVRGGPGVGKTRLIEEWLQTSATQGWRVLRGHCESYLGAEPLQPFLQMLRSLRDAALGAPDGAAAAEAAQARLAAGGDAVGALRDLLDACAAERPLILVLDDWQWADEASQQVLDAVRALARPIFALLALRSGGEPLVLDAGVRIVELAPLSAEETAQAVAQLLPGADPFLVTEIHRHAGGNPLFIEELCHSAQRTAQAQATGPLHGSAAWLGALIESRVARLPEPQLGIVRAAAVIGNVFPAWLLERLSGAGENDARVQQLAELDLIFPAERRGWLRFKHGITRDVVYEAVGLDDRVALHRAAAKALAEQPGALGGEEPYESLAYHHAAGGQHAEAAHYAELAGDKAAAAPALDRARAQYTAALEALDAGGPLSTEAELRWCAVAEKLGMACVFDPLSLSNGVRLFERGLALARHSGSTRAVARAEYWMGNIFYSRGLARQAQAHCEAALALADGMGDERLAAQVRATLGQVLHSACDYEAALPLLNDAIDSKRRQRRPGSSIAVGSAYTLACKGAILGDQGRFDLADECFAEALELLGDQLHQVGSSVRNWISSTWQWQGRWQEAAEMADASVRVAEQVKSRQLLAMSRALRGHARWVLDGAEAHLQEIRDATGWIEARQGGLVTSLNYGFLVQACASLGLDTEARRHAARLMQRARQHDRLGEAQGCRALARRAASAGDARRAAHYLAQADRAADARAAPHERAKTLLCRAGLERAAGRPAEAEALSDQARTAFERLHMHWYLARVEELSGDPHS